MIRIVVDDAGKLTEKEATALGHMFMHLAGHSLQAAPQINDTETSEQYRARMGIGSTPMRNLLVDKDLKENLTEITGDVTVTGSLVPPPPVPTSMHHIRDIHAAAQDETYFEDELVPEELIPSGPEKVNIDTPTPEVLRDSAGIRWDDRIHAKNKAQTASGLWKLGRNLSPDFVKQVQAELRAEITSCLAPATTAVVPPPPVPKVPAPAVAVPPPPVPPVPKVPAPPTPQVSAAELFDVLLNRVTADVEAKRYTMQAVVNTIRSFKDAAGNPICMHMGAVASRPDLIPAISAELDRISVA